MLLRRKVVRLWPWKKIDATTGSLGCRDRFEEPTLITCYETLKLKSRNFVVLGF